ncbi:MAG: bifunctional methylenetetrahydrofolate dehydrogenase/methenyltetrahydrofolate cyclohydrolase FolD [Chloroflexota bacterium]
MTGETTPGRIINGAEVSSGINRQTVEQVGALAVEGIVPTLTVVHVGEAPAAQSYRKQITREAARMGITVRDVALSETSSPQDLEDVLTTLNDDRGTHGVLVQTPLTPAFRRAVLFRLSSDKDPEGVTPRHLGMLFLGSPEVLPCTPAAILTIIKQHRADLTGARVVVVNGSPVIGRPLAILLIEAGATPIICTIHTRDLASETRRADVLVVAAGRPALIGRDHVSPGTVVIDAAVNRLPDGTLVGDVDTAAVLDRVAAITPVPGGVGPVTTASLLANVVTLATLHRGMARRYS